MAGRRLLERSVTSAGNLFPRSEGMACPLLTKCPRVAAFGGIPDSFIIDARALQTKENEVVLSRGMEDER